MLCLFVVVGVWYWLVDWLAGWLVDVVVCLFGCCYCFFGAAWVNDSEPPERVCIILSVKNGF